MASFTIVDSIFTVSKVHRISESISIVFIMLFRFDIVLITLELSKIPPTWYAGVSTTTSSTTRSSPSSRYKRDGSIACSLTLQPALHGTALRVARHDKLKSFYTDSLNMCEEQCLADSRCRSITFKRYGTRSW